MSDRIRRWARVQEMDVGPFCFSRAGAPAVIVRRFVVDADGERTGEVWLRTGKGPPRRVEDIGDAELRRIAAGGRQRLHHLDNDQLRRLMKGEEYSEVVKP